MDQLLLITANDELEAYLIETILKKNNISCKIETLATDKKKKYNDAPDMANVFVNKEKYDEAFKLIDVIKEERKMKVENEDETKLFTKKQLFFAISITIIFLSMIIMVVVYSMK